VASGRPAQPLARQRRTERERFNSGLLVAPTGSESTTNPQLAYKKQAGGWNPFPFRACGSQLPGFGSLLAMEIDKKEREIDGGCAWWRSRARALPSNAAPCSSSGLLTKRLRMDAWIHGWMVLHVPIFSTEHKLSRHASARQVVISLITGVRCRRRFLPSAVLTLQAKIHARIFDVLVCLFHFIYNFLFIA